MKAKAGKPVVVKNADGFGHTVTADDKAFDTGKIAGGTSTTIKIAKAGTYPFHCAIHNNMTGTIIVS